MDNEKLKIWLGFTKFILGTFALGLVTLLFNNQIKTKQLELEEQNQVARYLEHAIKEDVGVRYRFAQYFSTVTRSDDIRLRWHEYFVFVKKEFDSKEKRKNELELKAKSDTVSANEFKLLTAEIEKIRKELSVKTEKNYGGVSAVEKAIPEGVKILEIIEEGGSIKLKGVASSNARISAFMRNISKLGIGAPSLNSIMANLEAGEKGSSFELTINE